MRDLHFPLYFVLHLTDFLYEMVPAVFSGFVAAMTIKDGENSEVILVAEFFSSQELKNVSNCNWVGELQLTLSSCVLRNCVFFMQTPKRSPEIV